MGYRVGTVVKVLCYKSEGSIPASVIGFFVDIKSFPSHYGPGVDSASNRNEYQVHFLGVILPLSCAVVMKSGNLNSLEPSGPLQVCNGTDLLYGMLYEKRIILI